MAPSAGHLALKTVTFADLIDVATAQTLQVTGTEGRAKEEKLVLSEGVSTGPTDATTPAASETAPQYAASAPLPWQSSVSPDP